MAKILLDCSAELDEWAARRKAGTLFVKSQNTHNALTAAIEQIDKTDWLAIGTESPDRLVMWSHEARLAYEAQAAVAEIMAEPDQVVDLRPLMAAAAE